MKIFRNISLFFLIGISISLNGQIRSSDALINSFLDSSYTNYFRLYTHFDAYSNAFSNNIANQLLQGGFLNDLDKSSIIGSLDEKNYLHNRNKIDLEYSWKQKNDNGTHRFFHLGTNFRSVLYSEISRDIIRLSLYGNQPFIGKELNFGRDYIINQSYQNIYLGSSALNPTSSGRRILRFDAGLVLGRNFDQVSVAESVFHTMENTYSTYIRSGFSQINSGNKKEHLVNVPGIGFTFSGDYYEEIGPHSFGFSLRDFGYLFWDETFTGSSYHINDTVKHIIPYTINPFNSDDWEFISLDSIESHYIHSIKDLDPNRMTYLPGNFSIFYEYRWIPEKLAVGGLYVRPYNALAWQEFNIYLKYEIWNNNVFKAMLNYDQAGGIHYGLSGNHNLSDNAKIIWGVHHLNSLFKMQNDFALGGWFGIYYRFKAKNT